MWAVFLGTPNFSHTPKTGGLGQLAILNCPCECSFYFCFSPVMGVPHLVPWVSYLYCDPQWIRVRVRKYGKWLTKWCPRLHYNYGPLWHSALGHISDLAMYVLYVHLTFVMSAPSFSLDKKSNGLHPYQGLNQITIKYPCLYLLVLLPWFSYCLPICVHKTPK